MEARQLFEKKIVNALLEFGLTEYEAKAYVALVSKGRLNASRISQLTGIPRERAYDALSNLETKGWSELVDEHPIQYFTRACQIDHFRHICRSLKSKENG